MQKRTKIKKIFKTANDIGNFLKLDKKLLLRGRKIISQLVKSEINNDYFSYNFDFSIKLKKNDKSAVPALRFTEYSNYKKLDGDKRSIRNIHALRNVHFFKFLKNYGILSGDDEHLLSDAFKSSSFQDIILPLQFGVNLESDKIIFKVFFWLYESYTLPRKYRTDFTSMIARNYFNYEKNDFLKNRDVAFFSLDFEGTGSGLKIYLRYDKYQDSLEDLVRFNFKPEVVDKFNNFIENNEVYFKKEMLLCFQIKNNTVSIKKIELFVDEKIRRDAKKLKKLTVIFLDFFIENKTRNSQGAPYFKNSYVYAIGENFLTVYFGLNYEI